MKIIDLLNKIANDEEVPEEIIFEGEKYEYIEGIDYKNRTGTFLLSVKCIDNDFLNKEVEILDKKKKILEKLEERYYRDEPTLINDIAHKINEIIDKINERR